MLTESERAMTINRCGFKDNIEMYLFFHWEATIERGG